MVSLAELWLLKIPVEMLLTSKFWGPSMFYFALFVPLLVCSASSWGLDWDVVTIEPKCKSGFFCTREEIPQQVIEAGIARRLTEMSDRALKAHGKVTFAFMSFSEETLFHSLCTLTRQGLKFEGFFDSKAGPPKGAGHRLTTECQAPGQKNVIVHYMGMPKNGKTGWRLHHNKFIIANYGGDQRELAFGSANLSNNGLSVNFENWNFVRGTVDAAFIKDHECDAEAMRQARFASQKEDNPEVFRAALDKCLSQSSLTPQDLDQILARDGAWAVFAPDDKDGIYKLLADQIRRVVPEGKIQIATYFFMHKPLVDELKAARKRGVTVEFLIDDDLYNGGGSIPAQKKFWQQNLRPSQTGFATRAFDTNEEIFQMQHHKFLILNGVGSKDHVRIFGGAGQFTLSAFRNNYENFYFIEDSRVVSRYREVFSNLWSAAKVVTE